MLKRILNLSCYILFTFSFAGSANEKKENEQNWIRINLLGYPINGTKVAIWVSKSGQVPVLFEIIEAQTKKVVYASLNIKSFGTYGPFKQTARINFSGFKGSGRFYIKADGVLSPVVIIN
ncbi:MAG: cellulase, partial [Pedobacter sp.]